MTHEDAGHHDPGIMLTPADEQAVDALVEHGFDADAAKRARPELAQRIDAANRLFACATERYPAEPPDPTLIDATLARIDRAEDERAERMRAGPRGFPTLGRGRWADFVAVACVAVLLFSIGVPMLNSMRHDREVIGCQSNLRTIGSALGSYHGDFNSRPIAAGFAPDLSKLASWDTYDNSRHLDPLHLGGYCAKDCLCCGNDADKSGYASQVPNEPLDRLWLSQSHLPLLVRTAFRGLAVMRGRENSLDHGGKGQNLLYGDLSIVFEVSPLVTVRMPSAAAPSLENIWIPADHQGLEDAMHAPAEWSAIDIFLLQ